MCIDYWFQFSQSLPLFFQHSSTPSATSTSGLEPSKPQHLTSPIQEWWDKRPASNAGFRWRKQAIIHQKCFNLIFSNILCKKKNIGSFMEFSQLDDWDMIFFVWKKQSFHLLNWIKKHIFSTLTSSTLFPPVELPQLERSHHEFHGLHGTRKCRCRAKSGARALGSKGGPTPWGSQVSCSVVRTLVWLVASQEILSENHLFWIHWSAKKKVWGDISVLGFPKRLPFASQTIDGLAWCLALLTAWWWERYSSRHIYIYIAEKRRNTSQSRVKLLMEEIVHYLGCIKPCK